MTSISHIALRTDCLHGRLDCFRSFNVITRLVADEQTDRSRTQCLHLPVWVKYEEMKGRVEIRGSLFHWLSRDGHIWRSGMTATGTQSKGYDANNNNNNNNNNHLWPFSQHNLGEPVPENDHLPISGFLKTGTLPLSPLPVWLLAGLQQPHIHRHTLRFYASYSGLGTGWTAYSRAWFLW